MNERTLKEFILQELSKMSPSNQANFISDLL